MTTISSTDICNCANEFSVVHKSTHRNSLNAEIIKNNNGSRSFDKNFLVDATDEICLQDIQEGQLTGCLEHNVDAEQNVDPLKEYLRDQHQTFLGNG